jgi:hypothetical protein
MALLNATYLVVLIVALTVVAVAAANKVITLPAAAGWAYLALIWPALIPLAILAGLFKDSLKIKIEKEDDK